VGSGVQLDSKSIQSTHSHDHMLLGLDSNILLDKDPSLVYPEELIRYFIMSSAVTQNTKIISKPLYAQLPLVIRK
jgi:hypothetical protein